ncbi:MAG: hypothetical protein AAGF86_17630, partial [Pseudomonadota bacterium]
GRFPAIWESASREAAKLIRSSGGDEVHVHLLAESDRQAEDIVCDLKPALGSVVRFRPGPPVRRQPSVEQIDGFSETQVDLFEAPNPAAQIVAAA